MKRILIGIYVDESAERVQQTLSAIRNHTPEAHELLLLVDGADAAVPQAPSTIGELPQSKTLGPAGAPASFNRLVSRARADVYVFLESGAVAGPGWLGRLIEGLEADPRNGLAGPSTNCAWNAQAVFPHGLSTAEGIAETARAARVPFGSATRTLEPLYSLSDFCYVVRREVIDAIGPADEGYGLGPCWEMDYNIRAARAGWRGVWACAAYVHRSPFTMRRQQEEARLFEASKRRYQDKFCGARLRGEKTGYRPHCRGDACPNFAPLEFLPNKAVPLSIGRNSPMPDTAPQNPKVEVISRPLASCIMPTCDRLQFVAKAVQCFLKQDYPNLELIVVDDGRQTVEQILPGDPRVRLIRLPAKRNVGAKRNVACAAAHGELIVHWDDDDWYPADRVRRQVDALIQKRSGICGTSVLYYFEPGSGHAWRYRYRGGRPWVAGNTLAYRKSWWAGHPFPEIQIGEDSRFVWSAPAESICDLQCAELCVARIHRGNTSRKQTNPPCWEPRPIRELESLLGVDWLSFAALDAASLPASETPLISCIMPTFNRRSFLSLTLPAFLAQDYPNKELIVVDDGEDQVVDLVRGLDRVHHIALKGRTSIGRKRNLACQAAQGSVIAHWDDDDWYGTNRLSYQVAPLISGESDLTGLENAFQLELPAGEFWRPTPELHRKMFVGDLHGGTLVYWKSLFDQGLRYPEISLAEDALFVRQAQQRGKRMVRLSNPALFVYVRHATNSWRFQAGQFLDRSGWQRVSRPEPFSEKLLNAFRLAAEPAPTSRRATVLDPA